MKINKSNFYQTLFVLVLLLQMYLPSFKINIFFQLAVLAFYLTQEKLIISVGLLKSIFPLLIIFITGFLGFLIFKNPIGFALKDIFHFIKPIQGVLIGFLFFKTINNTKVFVRTVVVTGLISAIIHFLILILFVKISSGDVNVIREFTRDNFLELIAIFFLGYYKRFFSEDLFASKFKIIFITLVLSCILYFSRTMMVVAVILLFSIHGYTKITKKSITFLVSIIFGIALLYTYLYSIKIDRGQPGLESFLYKIKIAPEELFKTKINRENHKDLWDHWRGYEAKRALALMDSKPLSYITGTGYGSLVNLKFKAPLTGSGGKGMKYISELHNGYPYLLYKTGIFGVFFYLVFLYGLYKNIYHKYCFETVFISAFGVFYLFTTLSITGIYNTNDTTIFVLGGLLFGLGKNQKNRSL